MITFCTTLFRLALNKRFYDLAKLTCSHDYLVLKSYFTQFALALMFGAFGYLTLSIDASEALLVPIYWFCALLAPIYLCYGQPRPIPVDEEPR